MTYWSLCAANYSPNPSSPTTIGCAPTVDRDKAIQQEFDIDSMDFLNYVTAIHERLGVNVPEADYGKVATISDALAYLNCR